MCRMELVFSTRSISTRHSLLLGAILPIMAEAENQQLIKRLLVSTNTHGQPKTPRIIKHGQ